MFLAPSLAGHRSRARYTCSFSVLENKGKPKLGVGWGVEVGQNGTGASKHPEKERQRRKYESQ